MPLSEQFDPKRDTIVTGESVVFHFERHALTASRESLLELAQAIGRFKVALGLLKNQSASCQKKRKTRKRGKWVL